MCRVLADIGPEIPCESLLLTPENSLINQALDPKGHPLMQLAGWGFGLWSEHLLKPDEPLRYRRPMAAFYDDNAEGIIPSLQASTLLAHCKDEFLEQMRGTTDTEFLYVLLISLLEGNSDDDVRRGLEEMLHLIGKAMEDLDLAALTKLKMALVARDRIIGINSGLGHDGEAHPTGDWRELRDVEPETDDHSLAMLLELDV